MRREEAVGASLGIQKDEAIPERQGRKVFPSIF